MVEYCSNCKKIIGNNPVVLKSNKFCSDICHLTFWKNEMPNLGGRFILDQDIEKLSRLEGKNRNAYYNEIVNFVMNNFDSTAFMLNVRFGDDSKYNQ